MARSLSDGDARITGALSFQYWPPAPQDQEAAVIVARFDSLAELRAWQQSEQNRALVKEAAPLVEGGVLLQLAGQAAAEYYGGRRRAKSSSRRSSRSRSRVSRVRRPHPTGPGNIPGIPRFVRAAAAPKRAGWTTVLRFDTAEIWMAGLTRPSAPRS